MPASFNMKEPWASTFGFIILMFTAVAWATPVPNIGLAKCNGVARNVITCPSPGQVPYYQDANHSINPPSHTKLYKTVYFTEKLAKRLDCIKSFIMNGFLP